MFPTYTQYYFDLQRGLIENSTKVVQQSRALLAATRPLIEVVAIDPRRCDGCGGPKYLVVHVPHPSLATFELQTFICNNCGWANQHSVEVDATHEPVS